MYVSQYVNVCVAICVCVSQCVRVYVCVAMRACVCVSLCPFLGAQGHPYMISLWEHKYLWRVLAVLYFIAFLLASELVRGGPLPLPRPTHTTMASAQPDARTHTTTTGAQADARTHTTTTHAHTHDPCASDLQQRRACSPVCRIFPHGCICLCASVCVCPCVFGGGGGVADRKPGHSTLHPMGLLPLNVVTGLPDSLVAISDLHLVLYCKGPGFH
jgi:hypothetical protein